MNQLYIQARNGGIKAFQEMLQNTGRDELLAVSESAGDTILTRDEFVKAMTPAVGAEKAGSSFDAIFNNAKLFRNHGETGEATIIEPEEVINLWEKIDGLGKKSWITVSEESDVTVAGKAVGRLAVSRRSVPKGWKLEGFPLDENGAFRPVHFLEAKITLDKAKFPVTVDELSGLIASVGDYQKALTRVSLSKTLSPNVYLNEFSIAPTYPGCDVIRMPNATKVGNTTYLNWNTRDSSGNDLNTACSAKLYKVDTWGTWTITDKGGTIEIIYNAIVDAPKVLGANAGTTYSDGTIAGVVGGVANVIVADATEDLIADLLRLANALIATKAQMTQANGGTAPSFEELKKKLLATYDKDAG